MKNSLINPRTQEEMNNYLQNNKNEKKWAYQVMQAYQQEGQYATPYEHVNAIIKSIDTALSRGLFGDNEQVLSIIDAFKQWLVMQNGSWESAIKRALQTENLQRNDKAYINEWGIPKRYNQYGLKQWDWTSKDKKIVKNN